MMSAFFRAGADIQKHFFSLNGGRLPADPACVPVAFSSDTNRAIPSPALLPPCGNRVPPQRTVLRETPGPQAHGSRMK